MRDNPLIFFLFNYIIIKLILNNYIIKMRVDIFSFHLYSGKLILIYYVNILILVYIFLFFIKFFLILVYIFSFFL